MLNVQQKQSLADAEIEMAASSSAFLLARSCRRPTQILSHNTLSKLKTPLLCALAKQKLPTHSPWIHGRQWESRSLRPSPATQQRPTIPHYYTV